MSDTPKENLIDATAEAIFSKLEKDDTPVTRPFDYEGTRFYIKKPSVLDVLNVQAKSVHEYGGKTIQALSVAQKNETIYTLFYCVVKGPNNLEPLFTVSQLEGLITNPKANALVDALTTAILTGDESKNS